MINGGNLCKNDFISFVISPQQNGVYKKGESYGYSYFSLLRQFIHFFVCVLIAAFPWVTRKIILLKNKTKLSIKRNADKHRLDDVFAVNTEATQKSSPVKIYLLIELVISMIQSAVDPRLWEGPGGFVGAVIGCMLFGLIPSYIVAVCITRQSPRIHKIACIVFCVLIFIVTARQIYEGMVYGG